MAMSTADLELIKDSINEAVRNFVLDYDSRNASGGRPTVSPNPSSIWVNNQLRRELGESFSSRLEQAAPDASFDANQFKQEIDRSYRPLLPQQSRG